jgi:hypothetical protein
MKNNKEKASICYRNLCVNLQGDTAKIVNTIAIGGGLILLLILANKALSK